MIKSFLDDKNCYLFERKTDKGQLQAIYVFASDEENAKQIFLTREDSKSRIREACLDTINKKPICLSDAVKEMAKMMLFSHMYFDESNRETDFINGFYKMYKFTPLRILYIIAEKQKEIKQEKKKVIITDDLFD